MEEQLDLASIVAVILGLHAPEIQQVEKTGSNAVKEMSPAMKTAWAIWFQLKPLASDGGVLAGQVRSLFETPGIDTRTALADRLRTVLTIERSLQTRLETLVVDGPYAIMYNTSTSQPTAPTAPPFFAPVLPNRTVTLVSLAIVLFITWAVASVASTYRLYGVALIVFALRALSVGYQADRLRVKRGWWSALGGLLPGNALMLLFAYVGYNLPDKDSGQGQARYSLVSRGLLSIPLVAPILLAVILTIASPAYMGQFFDYPVGLVLLAITIVLLAILASSVWLGFWKAKAQTGIGISIAATAAGWCGLFVLWLVLFGPAMVRISHEFPEILRGDFSSFQVLLNEAR